MINCLADRDLDAVYKPHLSRAVYNLGVPFVTFQVILAAVLALAVAAHLSWMLHRWQLLALTSAGLALGANVRYVASAQLSRVCHGVRRCSDGNYSGQYRGGLSRRSRSRRMKGHRYARPRAGHRAGVNPGDGWFDGHVDHVGGVVLVSRRLVAGERRTDPSRGCMRLADQWDLPALSRGEFPTIGTSNRARKNEGEACARVGHRRRLDFTRSRPGSVSYFFLSPLE